MKYAKAGDKVVVHYIGTLDNGRIFDSRDDASPLVFILGDQAIFPALENEIIGMRIGQVKNILVPAEDAFGPRRRENIIAVDRSLLPAERDVKSGQTLTLEFKDGAERLMRVVGVAGEKVVLDGNHALAGQDLTFALKLVDIRS